MASNKQQVELHSDRSADMEASNDSDDAGIWKKLADVIQPQIQAIMGINASRRKNVRSRNEENPINAEGEALESENIADAVEKISGSSHNSASFAVRQEVPREEREERAVKELNRRGIESPSEEQVNELLTRRVSIVYESLGKEARFVDVDFKLGTVLVKVNVNHLFFSEYVDGMDGKSKTAMELFIMSLAMALDATELRNQQQNELLMTVWDGKLRDYLKQIHVD